MFDSVFKRFVEQSPIPVMLNSILQRVLSAEKRDHWYGQLEGRQYTRNLLFSTVFELMGLVVFRIFPTINASYKENQDTIGSSIASVYAKLNGMPITVSQELVRDTGKEFTEIVRELNGEKSPLIPGYRIKMLDGNCIEATEHRLEVLRKTKAGALPGKSLVVYDPGTELVVDVFPCEDGHAQERSLLNEVVKTVEKRDVWVMDRNFCVVSFICGIAQRDGFFIVRQHKQTPYTKLSPVRKIGSTETGEVSEQRIEIIDGEGKAQPFRRIILQLKKETRDGHKELCIITNIPEEDADALLISEVYRKRWNIETLFQELESHLHSEVNSLGYPKAALFGFCVALVAYNALSILKATLRSQYGNEVVENEISGYYIAGNISRTYDGMMIAITEEQWNIVAEMSLSIFCQFLIQLAENIQLPKYKKSKRGPKKPRPNQDQYKGQPHVSTARLLAGNKLVKKSP